MKSLWRSGSVAVLVDFEVGVEVFNLRELFSADLVLVLLEIPFLDVEEENIGEIGEIEFVEPEVLLVVVDPFFLVEHASDLLLHLAALVVVENIEQTFVRQLLQNVRLEFMRSLGKALW